MALREAPEILLAPALGSGPLTMRSWPLQIYLKALRGTNATRQDITSDGGIRGQWECSGCWRGYYGSWEIREGLLWLVGLEGVDGEALLSDLFPSLDIRRGVPALWVNEVLRVDTPQGMVRMKVRCGAVVEQRQVSNL